MPYHTPIMWNAVFWLVHSMFRVSPPLGGAVRQIMCSRGFFSYWAVQAGGFHLLCCRSGPVPVLSTGYPAFHPQQDLKGYLVTLLVIERGLQAAAAAFEVSFLSSNCSSYNILYLLPSVAQSVVGENITHYISAISEYIKRLVVWAGFIETIHFRGIKTTPVCFVCSTALVALNEGNIMDEVAPDVLHFILIYHTYTVSDFSDVTF